MRHTKTKAGKLLGSAAHLSVKDYDQLIRELGAELARAYGFREVQARIEGVTAPPPPLPSIGTVPREPEAPTNKGIGPAGATVNTLLDAYIGDERSSYHSLRFRTRTFYDGQIRRLRERYGSMKLTDIDADAMQTMHDTWGDGTTAMANSIIAVWRIAVNFGASVLADEECERLAGAIKRVKSSRLPPRNVRITAMQADAVRAEAHRKGKPSIALAQAFQFDCKLGQKDTIGDWVPIDEPVPSELIFEGKKWVTGLRWNEIDNLILTHASSRTGEKIKIDLRNCPMVMDELARCGHAQRVGAMIICETTGRPWIPNEFRRWWRKIADDCDIPKSVRNADSGVGGRDEDGSKTVSAN